MPGRMIITIDGPGASGKSVVAQRLAERLQSGYRCLNTGAMYRAVGVIAARRCGDALEDIDCIARVTRELRIDFDWDASPPTLMIDGSPADADVHNDTAATYASRVARIPAVREELVAQQARIGRQMPMLVSEGRDQGSIVFPQAPFKFFLTADVSVRARRRYEQLVRKGRAADPETVLEELIRRDPPGHDEPRGPADRAGRCGHRGYDRHPRHQRGDRSHVRPRAGEAGSWLMLPIHGVKLRRSTSGQTGASPPLVTRARRRSTTSAAASPGSSATSSSTCT
jgi:cytidylate kinase